LDNNTYNISINKLFLVFKDSDLETEFKLDAIEKVKTTIRIAVSVGLAVFILVSILKVSDDDVKTFWLNSIMIPITGVTFLALTFSKLYHKIYLYVIGFIYVLGGLSAIYSYLYDPTFLMFLHLRIVFFTLIPFITLRLLLFSNAILLIGMFVLSTVFIDGSTELIIKKVLFFIPLLVVSVLAFYVKQRFERIAFINNKVLKEQNKILTLDRKRLESQGVLSVILQESVDTNLTINEFLENALNVILYLPWLEVMSKGSIFLTNKKNELEMIASQGLGELVNTCALIKSGQCLCGKALEKKELLFNNCVTAEHEIQPVGITPHGHYNVPIMLDDQVLGVLNLYVEHGHVKTDEEEEFLILVADTLASVIYRHQLELEKKQQGEELERTHFKLKDSIDYAQRIQKSLLKSNDELKNEFNNSLVSYLPKETVSGDFYFVKRVNEIVYVAVADCTGHGVPGALVSVIGMQKLVHIIDKGVSDVGKILDELNFGINKLLNNDSLIGSDGMDITLLAIDKKQNCISYAGAKGLFYIFDEQAKELNRIKTDRVSIGQLIHEEGFKFKSCKIDYTKDTTIFLLTDGIIDQFSIQNKKRIGSKRVKLMLENLVTLDLQLKNDYIDDFYNNHINSNQTDDITLISFKL